MYNRGSYFYLFALTTKTKRGIEFRRSISNGLVTRLPLPASAVWGIQCEAKNELKIKI